MTSPPSILNMLLSAREENRGPSMVTMVPESCSFTPSSLPVFKMTFLVRSQNAGHMGMWHTLPKEAFPALC